MDKGNDGVADTVTYERAARGVQAEVPDDVSDITGSAHDDTLTGNAEANMLTGGAGADRLNGGKGNDTLDGGAGADVLKRLRAGDDTASYAGSDAAVTVNLSLNSTVANGFAEEPEFRVNTKTENSQRDPSVTALSGGGFLSSHGIPKASTSSTGASMAKPSLRWPWGGTRRAIP